jgi:hypothetical protein
MKIAKAIHISIIDMGRISHKTTDYDGSSEKFLPPLKDRNRNPYTHSIYL